MRNREYSLQNPERHKDQDLVFLPEQEVFPWNENRFDMDERLQYISVLFQELRRLYDEKILWAIGREGKAVFVCYPEFSTSWCTFIGDIDEISHFTVTQLREHLVWLDDVRPMIWFPPSLWKNGIGEAEIERYHGRVIYNK